jgi:[ribosomal protein S5]-alanine N-acetyltransferase
MIRSMIVCSGYSLANADATLGLADPGAGMYPLPMNPLTTSRLRLVPATSSLVALEISQLPAFFEQLSVEPALDWPSENLAGVLPFFLEQLERAPNLAGWMAWYWIYETSGASHLVGGGGFKGAPVQGAVEIGYETRPCFRGRGFATEAVGTQVAWALKQPGVQRVFAETEASNRASIGVLHKLGFVPAGLGSEPGLRRFERAAGGEHLRPTPKHQDKGFSTQLNPSHHIA